MMRLEETFNFQFQKAWHCQGGWANCLAWEPRRPNTSLILGTHTLPDGRKVGWKTEPGAWRQGHITTSGQFSLSLRLEGLVP